MSEHCRNTADIPVHIGLAENVLCSLVIQFEVRNRRSDRISFAQPLEVRLGGGSVVTSSRIDGKTTGVPSNDSAVPVHRSFRAR